MEMKNTLEDFAIFGGKPVFKEILHVGRPNIGNREKLLSRINDMIDRRWFTNNGPYVREFEKRVAKMLGVKHCVAMCNGTVALEIAIRAIGMKDEVIVPSFTFIATPHSLQWQEISPVFCDIDPITYNIDPTAVERLITPRTTGIIGVHLWGQPCNIEAIETIAKKYNLRILFDASHAFKCSYKGQTIGGFGSAEVFSFHATKFMNTFEGGAVVTNDYSLAEKVRLMKNFGFAGMDNVIYVGTNGKMSEVSAAMGLTSLESLDEFIEANRRNYYEYRTYLANIPGIKLRNYVDHERNNFQYIIIEVDENRFGIGRDQLMNLLHAENIRVRRYFYPGCHRMEPYRSYFPNAGLLLPETEKVSEKVLSLPTGTSINPNDIKKICNLIALIADNGTKLREKL